MKNPAVNNIAWAAAGIGYTSMIALYDAFQFIIEGDVFYVWLTLAMLVLLGLHVWSLRSGYKTLKKYGYKSRSEHQFDTIFEEREARTAVK